MALTFEFTNDEEDFVPEIVLKATSAAAAERILLYNILNGAYGVPVIMREDSVQSNGMATVVKIGFEKKDEEQPQEPDDTIIRGILKLKEVSFSEEVNINNNVVNTMVINGDGFQDGDEDFLKNIGFFKPGDTWNVYTKADEDWEITEGDVYLYDIVPDNGFYVSKKINDNSTVINKDTVFFKNNEKTVCHFSSSYLNVFFGALDCSFINQSIDVLKSSIIYMEEKWYKVVGTTCR